MSRLVKKSLSRVALDLKDRRILCALDANSRQSASELGKAVGLSKQVVGYRLRKLVQLGVIQQFYAVYDTSKLGFTTYKVFLRLQNAGLKKQQEILRYLSNSEQVQFLIATDGMFDIVFNVLAKNVVELYSFFSELENAYGQFIAEKEMAVMIKSYFFQRDYLFEGEKSEKKIKKHEVYFGSSKASAEKLYENDFRILTILAKNARASTIEISRKIKLSPEAVGRRIKKLEVAGVIQSYLMLPDSTALGQTSYKLLLRLRNVSKENDLLYNYFKRQANTWFYSNSLGRWDVEVNLDVDNPTEFREVMAELKQKFSSIIREYNTLQIARVHKFDFYPFKA